MTYLCGYLMHIGCAKVVALAASLPPRRRLSPGLKRVEQKEAERALGPSRRRHLGAEPPLHSESECDAHRGNGRRPAAWKRRPQSPRRRRPLAAGSAGPGAGAGRGPAPGPRPPSHSPGRAAAATRAAPTRAAPAPGCRRPRAPHVLRAAALARPAAPQNEEGRVVPGQAGRHAGEEEEGQGG